MPDVTVANFNLHWGMDRRGRPFGAGDVCRDLDADALGVEELWRPNRGPSALDEFVRETGATLLELPLACDSDVPHPRAIRIPPGRPGTWGIGLVTRLPVRRRFDVDLGHAPGDQVPRRIALCAELEADGATFVFAVVHASHRIYGSPPQLHRLARTLDGERLPSVIVGDCNMWGAVLAPVLRPRRRAVRGATWPAGRPHSQIDHVWVTPDVEVVSGDVRPRTGSDHRPIRARLRIGA